MTITAKLQRFREEQARYRPQAPGDGMGNVHLSKEEAADINRLAQEATAYPIAFNKEEDGDVFRIGCGDFTTNRAFVWTIEAARQLASGLDGQEVALKLLAMAIKEVTEEVSQSDEP
jgi:hypothetical protein